MSIALAWAWALKNWRLVAAGVVTVALVGAYFYVTHLHHVVEAQKAQTQQAVRQAKVQAVTTQAVDQLATTQTRVEERTRVVVQKIQVAPGADTPVPPDVLAEWRRGLSDDAAPAN